jgi:hypothetical protein
MVPINILMPLPSQMRISSFRKLYITMQLGVASRPSGMLHRPGQAIQLIHAQSTDLNPAQHRLPGVNKPKDAKHTEGKKIALQAIIQS